jgi:hypothetical protein
MSTPDLSDFPDVDLPSNLTADGDSQAQDTGVQLIPFPFCLLFASRPWVTLTVAAPSPELAAATMDQFVWQVLNPKLAQLGYPPNICSWRSGACA